MDWSSLFEIANRTALVGWLLLLIVPRAPFARRIAGAGIPLLLGLAYGALVLVHFADAEGGFDSLSGVRSLFESEPVLLAGWLHYLAFDLFVGAWIVEDAERRSVPRWIVAPLLVATFLFGPLGFLLYRSVRPFAARTAAEAAA